MDMRIVALFVVVAAFAFVKGDNTEGKFEYQGRQCTWKELGERRSHDRTLKISCQGNKKKKIAALKCAYGGDPHPCGWYNQNNQANYYRCLVNELLKNQSPCSANSVTCSSRCPEITFHKSWGTVFTTDSLEMHETGEFKSYGDSVEELPYGDVEDDLIYMPYV